MQAKQPNRQADQNMEQLLQMSLGNTSMPNNHPCLRVLRQALQQEKRRRHCRYWLYPLSAAAVLLIVLGWQVLRNTTPSPIVGYIRDIQGILHIKNNGTTRKLTAQTALFADQRLETRTGSTAAIELKDSSTLKPAPRTVLQVHDSAKGAHIYLRQGAVRIHAAKQPSGQALHVKTASGNIKILGTKLDVRLVQRPDSTQQTHVRLYAGRLELSSAGQRVLLQPGMIGVSQSDRPPVTYAALWEVNELNRMFERTQQLLDDTEGEFSMPILIEFSTRTIWTVLPLAQFTQVSPVEYRAKLYEPVFSVAAYTCGGTPIDISSHGKTLILRIPKSLMRSSSADYVILKIPQKQGLFEALSGSCHSLKRPGRPSDSVSLTALIIPQHVQVEAQAGEIIEKKRWLGQQVVTVQARTERLPLIR